MNGPNETAYPQLSAEIGEKELLSVFTPSQAEHRFIVDSYSRSTVQALLAVQLKVLQRLGYFVPLAAVPRQVVAHLCHHYRARPFTKAALQAYDTSGSKSLHQRRVREYVGLRLLNDDSLQWLESEALKAAATKQELPDIINILLEELVHHRYELPTFGTLSRLANRVRSRVNDQIYREIADSLSETQRLHIDRMFRTQQGRSQWDALKREPKQPNVREVVSFLAHIESLRALAKGLPALPDISVPKRNQFVLEARALNVRDMQDLKPAKRYALAVLLIHSQLEKSVDDIADIFIRSTRNMDSVAAERLRQYQLEHIEQGEQLIARFRSLLTAFEDEGTDPQRIGRMRHMLEDDPSAWIERCDEHIAYAGNNYYPFMLQPYKAKRALLFQCLDALDLKSSSPDDALLRAIDWLRQFRSSHKEYVRRDAGIVPLDLSWLGDAKWRRLIDGGDTESELVHRKYLELCVFSHVMAELKSGDLYVQNSGQYDDYRNHLVSWEVFDAEIVNYSDMVGLPLEPEAFIAGQKALLSTLASQVDERFPDNEHVAITEGGLVLRRAEKAALPEGLPEVDRAITDSMATMSILDVLTETETWLDLHKLFGPLSGFESKIDDPRKRFLTTLFCYGCNLGPTQTAASVKGLSRKQVAWLNLH